MDNPFSWDYLTAPLSEMDTFGPFSILYLAVFGVIFLASAYLYHDAPRRFASHKLNRDLVRMASQWLMWVTGVGLFFFLFRTLRFPFLTLELRIWMYLAFAALLATLGYFIYYARTVYPRRLAAFEQHRLRRQYMSALGKSRSGSRRRRTTVR